MFSDSRLSPLVDVPSTKWHNLRDRFRRLIRSDAIGHVEEWYNGMAPREGREAFQRFMKALNKIEMPAPTANVKTLPSISTAKPSASPSLDDSVAAHKARHFASLYGSILSDEGRARLEVYAREAERSADSARLLDDVRISLTAIQGTLNPQSVTKEHFPPKVGAAAVGGEGGSAHKEWHRKRIDWMSKKVHKLMQNTVQNPMGGGEDNPLLDQRRLCSPTERFVKPKNQFDGDAVLKSLGLSGPNSLEKLREKREEAANAAVSSIDADGCHVYMRGSRGQNRVQMSSRNRIVATFTASDTSGWQTTTRELIKDHSGSALAKGGAFVSSEDHPSMARVTASTGMVVPHPTLKPK